MGDAAGTSRARKANRTIREQGGTGHRRQHLCFFETGVDEYGQLGEGTNIDRTSPVIIIGSVH
jgi:hypothetical protein